VKFTTSRKLQHTSNDFNLVFNHVHSRLKVVVWTETYSLVEQNKPLSLTVKINTHLSKHNGMNTVERQEIYGTDLDNP